MPKTLSFTEFEFPKTTLAEARRFKQAALVTDLAAFAAELDALFDEKVASLERNAARATAQASSSTEGMAARARSLRASTRWQPSATDLQRGRSALLQAFEQPQNLPLPEFAKLAHKSRQQIYKDLAARPRRLLGLSVGPRRQRLPEWQLDPLRLRLTQEVLKAARDVDAWTLFHALSEPLAGLRGRSPVAAVSPGNLNEVVKHVCNTLGVH